MIRLGLRRPRWKTVYVAYLFLKDVVAVLALIGVSYFGYLRVVTKPARMTASNEALLILGFIGGLMVTELLFGASHLARAEPVRAGDVADRPVHRGRIVSSDAHRGRGELLDSPRHHRHLPELPPPREALPRGRGPAATC